MLRRELPSPPVRLLLSLLVLKDAGRNHYTVPGVDKVVSYEPRHFADDGYKALLHLPPHLARVGHALIPPYRNVHSFCATSFPTTLPHGAFVCTLTGIAALIYSFLLEQARIREGSFSETELPPNQFLGNSPYPRGPLCGYASPAGLA